MVSDRAKALVKLATEGLGCVSVADLATAISHEEHHAGRGFSPQTLRVLTIIHNFHLQRPDGTTAAQRLFGYQFPDLFEWVVEHMGALPLARRSLKSHSPNPFHLEGFPV